MRIGAELAACAHDAGVIPGVVVGVWVVVWAGVLQVG